jgi:hypothetical protein
MVCTIGKSGVKELARPSVDARHAGSFSPFLYRCSSVRNDNSPAKPPALPERIEAVLQFRE